MHGIKSLLLGTLITWVSAVNPDCSNRPVYSAIAAQVLSYPEAQSYCSKNFPIPTKTTTVTGPASTSSITVATNTVTTTTATVTVTTTDATITTVSSQTITNTVTTTTTVTTTVVAKRRRRSAAIVATTTASTAVTTTKSSARGNFPSTTTKPVTTPTVARTTASTKSPVTTGTTLKTTQSLNRWQSVLSAESAVIGQICTCVENPVTISVTTTPITTTSVTATSTSAVAATVTSHATATVTSTNTVTVTTTVTETATATETACTSGNQCFGGKLYNVQCGTGDTDGGSLTVSTTPDYQTCGTQCGQNSQCQSWAWDNYDNEGECVLYNHINQAPTFPGAGPLYVYAYQVAATC